MPYIFQALFVIVVQTAALIVVIRLMEKQYPGVLPAILGALATTMVAHGHFDLPTGVTLVAFVLFAMLTHYLLLDVFLKVWPIEKA